MNDIHPHLFLHLANFVFILTNLYGWALKTFYRAEPYRDNYDNLFPSQRANAALYLLQLFEIPYLLMLPNPKALFYVNAFSILLFSSLMVVMNDRYFFLKRKNRRQTVCHFLPVGLIVGYLLLATWEVLPTTANTYRVMFWIVTTVFLYYIARLVVIRLNLRRSIRAVDEGTYSNSDDFPVRYARRIEWVPITICGLMFACFVLNTPAVKMWRDWLFTVVNVAFLLYTLHPHYKSPNPGEEPEQEQELEEMLAGTSYKLSPERCKEIEGKLIELLETEKLYLDCHLTLDQLSQKIGINRNYLSEVIARSTQGSFYALINSYRLAHAQEILRHDPTLKIESVAFDSGFSSARVFSQIFKRNKGIPPSLFAKGTS